MISQIKCSMFRMPALLMLIFTSGCQTNALNSNSKPLMMANDAPLIMKLKAGETVTPKADYVCGEVHNYILEPAKP